MQQPTPRPQAPVQRFQVPAPRPVPRTVPPSSNGAAMFAAPEDDTLFDVADIHGNVLAPNLKRLQIRARLDAGLLTEAALARKEGDREFRPLADVLGGSGTHRVARYWYVTVKHGPVIGPVETALVERGILAGKVPVDSEVCEVGDDYWSPLEVVDCFRGALDEVHFDAQVTSAFNATRHRFSFTG